MTVPVFKFNARLGDVARLPAWARRGAVVLLWMLQAGILEWVGQTLRFARVMGRYSAVDYFAFAAYTFGSPEHRSFHQFAEDARPYRERLAGVLEREAFPVQPTACRYFRDVPIAVAQAVADGLLQRTFCGTWADWRESGAVRDRQGHGWQVFDFDYKHVGIRQRALPEGDDLPDPQRLGAASARPGYTGRHRGEVVQNHGILVHRGSAQCLRVEVQAGNSSMAVGLPGCLAAIEHVCARDGLAVEDTLVVLDGEGRRRACLEELAAAALNFITRCDQYDRLDDPALQRHLNAGEWYRVRDSGSGPTRYAIDIGDVPIRVLEAGGTSREVRLRLVLSRFRPQSDHPGAGRTLGEQHWELFVCRLSRKAFGPEDVVALYMGRGSVENQYACADRELNLGHVYCEEPGGQLLALAIGLAVWNVEIWLGERQRPTPHPLPLQLAGGAKPERSAAPLFPAAAPPAGDAGAARTAAPAEPQGQAGASFPDLSASKGAARAREVAAATDWSRLPRFQPGAEFVWDAQRQALVCAAGQELKPFSLMRAAGHLNLRLVAPLGPCGTCHRLSRCANTTRAPAFRREVKIRLPGPPAQPGHQPCSPASPSTGPFFPRVAPSPAGPYKLASSSRFPATARRHFASLCLHSEIHVLLHTLPPPLQTADQIDQLRSHRRLTWTERFARNALHATREIQISAPALLPILSPDP
jgi:hypothetical protein